MYLVTGTVYKSPFDFGLNFILLFPLQCPKFMSREAHLITSDLLI